MSNLSDKEIGYLVGLYLGDGYTSYDNNRHYKVGFCLNPKRDGDIIERTFQLLIKMGLAPYRIENHGCLEVRANSKEFYRFLLVEYTKWQSRTDYDYQIGLVSGLIDSDGHIGNGETVITNKDENILKIVEQTLKKLKIQTKLWKQQINGKGKWNFEIFRLRISTKFKQLDHNSSKIIRKAGF